MGFVDYVRASVFNKAVQSQYRRLENKIQNISTSLSGLDSIGFKIDQLTTKLHRLETIVLSQHDICMVSGTSKMYFQHGPGERDGEVTIRDTSVGDFKKLPNGERHTFKFQYPCAVNDLVLTCSLNCVILQAVHNGTLVTASGSSVMRIAVPQMASLDILTVTIQRVY